MDQSALKALLAYDPKTGVFVRRTAGRGLRGGVGEVAGTTNGKGYVQITVGGRIHSAHRLAWLYMTGTFPSGDIDHRNGVRSDNRWCNLRDSSVSENRQNIGSARVDNKLGVLGVIFHKATGKYKAAIQVAGKRHNLGYFDEIWEASAAYLSAKDALHPTHFRLRNKEK